MENSDHDCQKAEGRRPTHAKTKEIAVALWLHQVAICVPSITTIQARAASSPTARRTPSRKPAICSLLCVAERESRQNSTYTPPRSSRSFTFGFRTVPFGFVRTSERHFSLVIRVAFTWKRTSRLGSQSVSVGPFVHAIAPSWPPSGTSRRQPTSTFLWGISWRRASSPRTYRSNVVSWGD